MITQKTTTKTIQSKALQSFSISLQNLLNNTTVLQVLGSNTPVAPGLGTGIYSTNITLQNGRLDKNDPSQLTAVDGNHYLNPYTAKKYNELKKLASQQKINLTITKSYQDYNTQQEQVKEQGLLYDNLQKGNNNGAADPGTSLYGLGTALDFSSSPEVNKFLKKNAPAYGFSRLPGTASGWIMNSEKIPTDYLNKAPNFKNIPQNTNSAVSGYIPPGDLRRVAEIAILYNQTKTAPNPIKAQRSFFEKYNTEYFLDLDNNTIFEYYKKFNASIEDVQSIRISFDSPLTPVSDCFGLYTNIFSKYSDAVAPPWDFYAPTSSSTFNPSNYKTQGGGPFVIPATSLNKLHPTTVSLLKESSSTSTAIFNSSMRNIYKPSKGADIQGADQTTSHGINLIPDLTPYIQNYINKKMLTENLKGGFKNTFDFNTFFSTVNDFTGYNPRNYASNNLEKMHDIYFDINIEGKIQKVDLLQKKYKHSRSTRTIKKALCISGGCREEVQDNNINAPAALGEAVTSEQRVQNLAKHTPISFTEKANNKIADAQAMLARPSIRVAEVTAKLDQITTTTIPIVNDITKDALVVPLTDLMSNTVAGITQPVAALLNSASSLTTTQQTDLNIPTVLPSFDLGSFPQIAGLAASIDPRNVDPVAVLDAAQQAKDIICNFKLPVIGKIDFQAVLKGNFDNIGDEFEKFINSLQRKLTSLIPTEEELKKQFTSIIPSFKKLFKEFYKKFFECDNKKEY